MDRVVNNEDLILKPLTEADHDKDCIYKYDYDSEPDRGNPGEDRDRGIDRKR